MASTVWPSGRTPSSMTPQPGAHENAAAADALAELHVDPLVADDPRARQIDAEIARRVERHAGRGLAAAACLTQVVDERLGMVRTEVPAVDAGAAGRQPRVDDGVQFARGTPGGSSGGRCRPDW